VVMVVVVVVVVVMMMMSRLVERVINGPQMCCQSAERVGLQMSSECHGGESCRSQGKC